jgi:hypothetical protein
LDGSLKSLSGGEFSFKVYVNGTEKTTVANAASGSSRDLGQFNDRDDVEVCENANANGYTPDVRCISHTMSAGENFTFSFVNRKTTPPPTVTNVTQPQEIFTGDPKGETYDNFCANVTAPAGDQVTVSFGARFGIGFTRYITAVAGVNKVCGIYTGPSDLPFVWTPPSWSGISKPDTWEQVHVIAFDTTTGLNSTGQGNPPPDSESYVWFPVREPPVVCCAPNKADNLALLMRA